MTFPADKTSRIDRIIETLLIALFVFLPATYGAVDAWSKLVATLLGSAVALCLAFRSLTGSSRFWHWSWGWSWAWLAMAMFITLSLLQLFPLPASVIEAISPATASMRTKLLADLGDHAHLLARQTLSFYPLATRHDLRLVLLASTVFAAVAVVCRNPAAMRRLLKAIALIGLTTAILALAQDLTHTRKIYWLIGIGEAARSGPFVNHSHYGQFMNLSIGCALALLLIRLDDGRGTSLRTRFANCGWLAAMIVLGLVTICLSLTRGGIIAIFISGALATLGLLVGKNTRGMVIVLIVLAVTTTAALSTVGLERVYARMLERGAVGIRVQMVKDITVMSRSFPHVGMGLGTFEWTYPAFDRTLSNNTATHADNEYAQTLAEMGWCGLAAVLLFVIVIVSRYMRAVRSVDSGVRLAAIGLGYGLVAILLQSVSDFGQHIPAIACLSAVTCGLLMILGRPENDRRRHIALPWRAAGAASVAVLTGWMLLDASRAALGERRWQDVEELRSPLQAADWQGTDQQYSALLSRADQAISADPDNAYYRYWTAVYHWKAIGRQRDTITGRVVANPETIAAAERIVDALNDARRRCPTYGPVYTVLGQIEEGFLNRPVGFDHIQTGYLLTRNDTTAHFAAARAEARRGEWASAAEKFQTALILDGSSIEAVISVYLDDVKRPDLLVNAVGDEYFRLYRAREGLRSRPELKDLADAAHRRMVDVLQRECEAADAPASKLSMLGAHRAGQGRYDIAEPALARALEADPNNLDWRIRRADVLLHLGRNDAAINEAKIALRLDPNSASAKAIVAAAEKSRAAP